MQLVTLRGSILEDATPSTAKAGSLRGLPLRDVLEFVLPELNTQCLRLALASPKVPEQLLKLDEQGVRFPGLGGNSQDLGGIPRIWGGIPVIWGFLGLPRPGSPSSCSSGLSRG